MCGTVVSQPPTPPDIPTASHVHQYKGHPGNVGRHGQTGGCRAFRDGDGGRHNRRRFPVFQKPILGTTDSEYRHRPGLWRFLLQISQASLTKRIDQQDPPLRLLS